MRRSPSVTLALCLLAFASGSEAAVVNSIFGGRIACAPLNGTQYCGGDVAHRVESFDGVPIDVNLTLPATSVGGAFPLIIDLHGWGLGKTDGASPYALQGYAVMSFSARGFHGSCGSADSRVPDATLSDPNVCATRGWTHLGDARFEARDAQYLAGLLVDEGVVLPTKIAAEGISYGGGRSMVLGALRNRVMLADGSLVPWTSPAGVPMEIAAAVPMIPWSDLAYALAPSGTMLDYRSDNPYGTRSGVAKEAWNEVLFSGGLASGYYAPDGADPDANLIGWNARTKEGEPYDADPASQDLIHQLTSFHSAYYIDDSVPPAPMLIYNAWTDDLFPADEGLRFFLKTRAKHPDAEIGVNFADGFGHPRASLGSNNLAQIFQKMLQLFDRYLKDAEGEPLPRVETYTQNCGGSTQQGPFFADEWDAIHPGEVRFTAENEQVIDEESGDPAMGEALAPTAGGPCRTLPADDDPTAATYRLPTVASAGYTLMGAPTVIARLAVSGVEYAQLNIRLWDVAPDGTQSLVTHAAFRPRGDDPGAQPFQLHPNGWQFVTGHTPKLELVGRSAPTAQASTGKFTIAINELELRLPVMETPDGGKIEEPATPVLPVEAAEPPPCPPAPISACTTATKSSITLAQGKVDKKDRLTWSWKGGETDIETDEGLTLCLYDGSDKLLVSEPAPANGGCKTGGDDVVCWVSAGDRSRYQDKKGSRTGVRRLMVNDGDESRLRLFGKGTRLGLPTTPLESLPLTVQLIDGDGGCWGAAYTSAKKNDGKKLKASN